MSGSQLFTPSTLFVRQPYHFLINFDFEIMTVIFESVLYMPEELVARLVFPIK